VKYRVWHADRLDLGDHPAVNREYVVQVFRPIKTFRPDEVEVGVRDALRLGALGFEAVTVREPAATGLHQP